MSIHEVLLSYRFVMMLH